MMNFQDRWVEGQDLPRLEGNWLVGDSGRRSQSGEEGVAGVGVERRRRVQLWGPEVVVCMYVGLEGWDINRGLFRGAPLQRLMER